MGHLNQPLMNLSRLSGQKLTGFNGGSLQVVHSPNLRDVNIQGAGRVGWAALHANLEDGDVSRRGLQGWWCPLVSVTVMVRTVVFGKTIGIVC